MQDRMLDPIGNLVRSLSRLPGIGEKTATRLAFFLMDAPEEYTRELGQAIMDVHKRLKTCSICRSPSDQDPCAICSDPGRDSSLLCVVAHPQDLMAIERTGGYRGRYHVLGGLLSPLDGKGPDDRWTSLYYPGEAMPGLLLLDDLDPQPKWVEAAARGMGYLARSRAGKSSVPADHWALLATAKLLAKLRRMENPPVSRTVLLQHAVQICRAIAAHQVRSAAAPRVFGGLISTPWMTCPSPCPARPLRPRLRLRSATTVRLA